MTNKPSLCSRVKFGTIFVPLSRIRAFELQALKDGKFLCFTLFEKNQRIDHIFATNCSIVMGFGSRCSIFDAKIGYIQI